jgi:hypothetical protein
MKCLAVLVVSLSLSLLGCGGNPLNPAASNLQNQPQGSGPSNPAPPSPSAPPATTSYDMLEWMTMSADLSVDHHMAGTANPLYTSVLPDRFFWTKTGQGFPWDIQLYDNNYIYLWVTELDWSNPSTFKVFNSPTLGKFNLPLAPRFAQGGFPGSSIKISDSTYEIHSDCNTFVTKSLGHVINEIWGPYTESLGGALPNNLETLVISYRYSCDSSYSNCGDKEEYHLAKPYGLVKWQHQKLQADGTYATPDNVTYFNQVVAGQTKVVTTCF